MNDPAAGALRLLYIDDDPEQRLLVRLALERLGGWQITLAGSGDAQLPALAQHTGAGCVLLATAPDPAVTEAVLAMLRADERSAALPVVILAVLAPPAAAARWRSLGALEAITGPLVPSALPARLRALRTVRRTEPGATPPAAPDTDADPIADLRRSFLAQLPERRQALRSHWQSAVGGDPGAADEVRLIAHRLAGTGATFDQPVVGTQARRVETALLAWRARPGEAGLRAAVDTALADFEAAVSAALGPSAAADAAPMGAAALPPSPAPAAPPASRPTRSEAAPDPQPGEAGAEPKAETGATATLWAVGIAPMLLATLSPLELQLRTFADLDAALSALEAGVTAPAATLIGTAMLGRPEAIARLRARAPLALYSGRGSLADRIAGVHAGAETCFAATVDQAMLGEWLEMRCVPRVGDALRVLLVDDDPMFIALCSNLLSGNGFVVRTMEHPYALCEELAEFEPDVLLLDLYLRDCTGLEVATALRQFPGWSTLPIVFLSADHELARQAAALGAGLDDWLSKPFEAVQLRQVVQTRALRGRRLRARVDTDPLTGVLSAGSFESRLGIEVGRAQRYGRALSLVLIDPDELGALAEAQGRGAVDRLLCLLAQQLGQRVRRSDLLGRGHGAAFALALTETGGDVAGCVIETLRSAWQRSGADAAQPPALAGFSAGLAALRPGENASALHERALRALRAARRAGGNRLLRMTDFGDQTDSGCGPAMPNTTSSGRGSLM